MSFGELLDRTLDTMAVLCALSAGLAIVRVVADIWRERPPSRGATIFALSVFAGIGAWSLVLGLIIRTFAVPAHDYERHAFINFLAFAAAIIAASFLADCLSKIWPNARGTPEQGPERPAVIQNAPPAALSTQVHRPAVPCAPNDIQSGLDHAPTIRNPLSAFANTIGTNAQISALDNAARLADATARTAEAEAKGFEAIMRREDRLIEVRVRQQIAPELAQNKIEMQRDRLREDEHQRSLAIERRSKEEWDAKRDTVRARNGEEAERRFKERKYELYERRARARMADVDVDTATANAASRKLGGDRTDSGDTLSELQEFAAVTRQRILSAAAEGEDTGWLQEHVARIERLLEK